MLEWAAPASPHALHAMARGFFTNRRGQSLYYSWHAPVAAPRSVWVWCNALLEEGAFATRFGVMLADALVAQGVAMLRFDCAGQGDSEGDARSLSADDWVADITDAAAWAQAQMGPGPTVPLGWVGLRAGALLATAAAVQCAAPHQPQRLLLLEPVMDGARYLDDALRAHLTTQLACYQRVQEPRAALRAQLAAGGVVSVMGHEVGQAFAESLAQLQLGTALDQLAVPVHVLHLPRLPGRERPAALQALAERAGVTVHDGPAAQPWDGASSYWEPPPELLRLCVRLCTAEGEAP